LQGEDHLLQHSNNISNLKFFRNINVDFIKFIILYFLPLNVFLKGKYQVFFFQKNLMNFQLTLSIYKKFLIVKIHTFIVKSLKRKKMEL
jgi:hypothetical protein